MVGLTYLVVQLLKHKFMSEALKRLDATTASYISVYLHGIQPNKPDFTKLLASKEWDLEENPALWKCNGQPYLQWVSKFVYSLLLRTKSDILRACHAMVSLRLYAFRLTFTSSKLATYFPLVHLLWAWASTSSWLSILVICIHHHQAIIFPQVGCYVTPPFDFYQYISYNIEQPALCTYD